MKLVRVGVIGTGWGQLQIEAFRRVKSTQVVALCDTNAEQLSIVSKQYHIADTYSDYNALLASEAVDWVAIATPSDLHFPIARAAIEAGKHILCEKPLALNPAQAQELVDAASAKGIVDAVDYEMRFLPANAYAKELIEEDYIGALLRVDVTMVMENPWGEHGNWVAQDERGGGVLMELGTHFIDTLRWWFGDVSSVLAGRRTYFPTVRIPGTKEKGNGKSLRMAVSGDDAFWCVFQFARGGEALFSFVTGARHDPGWTIGAYGQTGSLVNKGGQLWAMREGDREMGLLPIPKRLELGRDPDDPLMWGMAKLIERAATKINGIPESLPVPDFRDGLAVAQIVDAIRRSSDERRWVEVDGK